VIPTTSTTWTVTLADNPPVPVVGRTGGPRILDVTVAGLPFGPGPMPPTPRSYPATLERHDGPFVVERITGQAWSTGIAIADDRGIRFQFRFVPDLIVEP
jgi:hypothetical protein